MSCKTCLLTLMLICLLLALVGYLIESIFIIPLQSPCSEADQIYDTSPINISLNTWIQVNLLSGLTFFSIFAVCGRVGLKSKRQCIMAILGLFVVVFVLFEGVWNVIGIVLYESSYKDTCRDADSFKINVTIMLFYGNILFPLLIIIGIVSLILICRKQKPYIKKQPLLNGQIPIVEPKSQQSTESNIYKRIYNRLSGSVRQNSMVIN